MLGIMGELHPNIFKGGITASYITAGEYYNLRLGSVWEKFVEIEINDWLQTALNWILNGKIVVIVKTLIQHLIFCFSFIITHSAL